MDTRDIYKLVRQFEEEKDDVINLYDSMDIELNEGFVIETGVVGFMEDGVIVHLDEDAMEFLDFNGVLLESERYDDEEDEPGFADELGPVGRAVLHRLQHKPTHPSVSPYFHEKFLELLSKYGPEAVMAAIQDIDASNRNPEEIGSSDTSGWAKEVIHSLEAGHYKHLHEGSADVDSKIVDLVNSEDPFMEVYNCLKDQGDPQVCRMIQDMYNDISVDYGLHPDDDFEDIINRILDQLEADYLPADSYEHLEELAAIKKLALGEGWAYSDHWDSKYDDDGEASPREKARAQARRRAEDSGWGTDDERENDAELEEGLGKALLGGAALIAAITGINKINKIEANHLMKTEPQLVKLAQMRQAAAAKGDEYEVQSLDDRIEKTLDHIRVTGRPVMGPDGKPVVPGEPLGEAEYQGRKVQLNKPMAGDVKKSKVYVKKPNGKVVKVNFGDKNMRIKKSNPNRRKSFRARHHCENPGPKWKARYWSCRAW